MQRVLWAVAGGCALFILASCATNRRSSPPSFPTFTRTLQVEATADTSANVSIGDVNRGAGEARERDGGHHLHDVMRSCRNNQYPDADTAATAVTTVRT